MWLVFVVIVIAVIVLAALISLGRREVPVRAERATRGDIVSTISTNGKIQPLDNFEAHAPAPTIVRRVYVHEGDHVKAGQMLLQLDNADARAQAARARAQLRGAEASLSAVEAGGTREEVLATQSQLAKAQTEVEAARRNLEALQRLQQKGAASAGEVEAASNRLKTAQADLKLAQGRQSSRYSASEVGHVRAQATQARAALAAAEDLLRRSEVRAPRDGVVYSEPVRPGQFVNTGDLLVQVADLRTVQVLAFVDEPDIGRLQVGQQVDLTWDALPGRTWKGTLTRVPATVVALGARNVGQVTCQVGNDDMKLLPNVNVNVNIVTAKATNTLAVSREAVHQENGQRFVYQIVDGRLERRIVQTGISNLTQVQITNGLTEGALVALGSADGKSLQSGVMVKVV